MNWGALIGLSLRKPKAAAQYIVSLNLPRAVLWQLLILVCIGNATMMYLTHVITPTPAAAQGGFVIPDVLFSPFVGFAMIGGGVVITVHVLHWLAATLGGPGRLEDMLALLTWLQALRALAQLVMLVLVLVIPPLAGLFALFVVVMSFWLLVVFVNEGAGFNSITKAIGILLTAAVGIVLGLSFLLTLTGVAVGIGDV